MSNTSTFAVGLGSGLAFWYLTKSKKAAPAGPDSTPITAASPAAARNCAVTVDANGLTADGARVDLAEAVRLCKAAGRAAVTVARNAPASSYAELMTALQINNASDVRNASGRKTSKAPRRRRNSDTSSSFTLAIYPEGIAGPTKRVRWFRTDTPMTWASVRDQLAKARIIDPAAIAPNTPGYWRLTTEPRSFKPDRAESLPGGPSQPRGASRATQRYSHEGRTILRDGEAILYVERVDLGDQRYAISPYHADVLTDRIVRLLNKHGAR
jgi:hypothetical protein